MPAKTSLESKYVVSNAGCWLWRASVNHSGYGVVRVGKTQKPAHRVVYEKHKGKIAEGLHLDHLCRNHGCVNPDHLEPVTPRENKIRGLGIKVTPSLAVEIRTKFASGSTIPELRDITGLCFGHISQILHGKYWAEAGGPIVVVDGRKYRSKKTRKDALFLENGGVTKTVPEWARILGIRNSSLRTRLYRGLTGEQLFKPATKGAHNASNRVSASSVEISA